MKKTMVAYTERSRAGHQYGCRTAMAALLSFLLIVLAGTSMTQEQEKNAPMPLAKEAMIHHFRQTRDPGLILEQVYSAQLFFRGKLKHEEIVRLTLEKRRDWNRLRETGLEGQWHASEKGKTLLRAAGRMATQLVGAGGTGVEAANMVIHYYEAWMQGREVPRAAQRLAEDYRKTEKHFASPEGMVFESIARLYEAEKNVDFRKAWNALFEPTYGFKPNDSDQTVMENYPGFADHELIGKIWKTVQEGDNKEARLRTAIKDIHKKSLGDIDEALQRIAMSSEETLRQRTAEAQRRQAAQVEEIDMAGSRSAVSLAATFIGFVDPELGNQIRATSDAVFGMREAIKTYERAQELGANMNLASLALTGNVIGAMLTVAGIFTGGPTNDEIILDEIGRLRNQVHEMRNEMHKRFDGVHDHLDAIYDNMNSGFELLIKNDARNARKINDIMREIGNARSQLSDIIGLQLDTQAIMVQQGELLLNAINELELAPCTREYGVGDGDRMSVEKFRDCRAKIETLHKQLPGLQLDPESPEALVKWFKARPDRMISRSLEEFRSLLESIGPEGKERADALPESVVGPEAWFYVVETHDLFLAEHPVHAKRDAKDIADSAFVREMHGGRSELRRYAEAIRDELQTFQDDTGKIIGWIWETTPPGEPSVIVNVVREPPPETVFSKLFEEKETWGPKRAEKLRQLIQKGYNSYYEEHEVRTVRGDDGTVIPEISFDEGLYAWRPLDEFYKELPEWIKLKGECNTDFQRYEIPKSACKQYDDFLHKNFHKLIHQNDLMLARLGLGKFEISWDADLAIISPRTTKIPADWWKWQKHRDWREILPYLNPPGRLPDYNPPPVYQRMNQIPLPLRSDWILAQATQPMPQMSWCEPKQNLFSPLPQVACYYVSSLKMDISYNGKDEACGKESIQPGQVRASAPVLYLDKNGKNFSLKRAESKQLVSPAHAFVDPPGRPALPTSCANLYWNRATEKKKALLKHVWNHLLNSEVFKDRARDMSIANAYLRSWLTLAFDEALGSDAIAAIALGQIGFPDLVQMAQDFADYTEHSVTGGNLRPAMLVDVVTERVRMLEEVLKSDVMRDVVKHGYGHRILTGTRFDNLGDERGDP